MIVSRGQILADGRYTVSVGTISSTPNVKPVGMIERHAMRDSTAAVVTRDKEFFEAQVRHDFHLILRHRTFAMILVLRIGARFAAFAVAA